MADEPNEMSGEFLDRFSIQIARVVLAAGHFDDNLTKRLTALLDLKPIQESALLRPMQPRAKLDLLERLAKQFLKTPQYKALCKFTVAAKKTLDERNALIHGTAGHKDGKVSFKSYTGQFKLTGEPQRWTLRRVADLADALMTHNEGLDGSLAILTNSKAALQTYRHPHDGFAKSGRAENA